MGEQVQRKVYNITQSQYEEILDILNNEEVEMVSQSNPLFEVNIVVDSDEFSIEGILFKHQLTKEHIIEASDSLKEFIQLMGCQF